MKKIITISVAAAFAFVSMSCQTTYDAYGNPRQTVDPGTAVAGAAAVGVLGYALARDKNKSNDYHYHNNYHRNRGYYGRHGHYRRY